MFRTSAGIVRFLPPAVRFAPWLPRAVRFAPWLPRAVGVKPRLARISVWVLWTVLAAALLAGGCKPREILPRSPELLLSPERDAVRYRSFVLPNQLKVMLVSNPNASRSAAALAVGVGSLDDPRERPGLVHFLEHMLFLGTEKYPQVGAYSKFMSSHAGFSNAYTADDHTNYFFAVSHDAFEEGLDRFANFFISPLLSEEYADREMNSVDSEHAKNVESDFWRTQQVQRLQYAKDHPINRFSTGTLETLRGVGGGELRAFYRGNYSSNRMTLTVVGNRSLAGLEALVRERFGAIVNRNLPKTEYPPEYLPRKNALRILRISPVKDQRLLTLEFPLQSLRAYYREKPLHMISSVLGHEGKGSLLSLLKGENLATTLSAGGGKNTANYASLEISVGLTPAGLRQYPKVIRHVLNTLAAFREKGFPRYLYEENRIMAELNHRYRAVPESASEARRLSAMMLSYPLEALPHQPFLLTRYDPGLYRGIFERLTPDNMLVTLIAKGVRTDSKERYYGTLYSYEEVTGEDYRALFASRPDARWRLPAPNPFIPGRVNLRQPAGPLKLAGLSFHHLKDDGLPEAIAGRLRPLQGALFTGAEAFVERMEAELTPSERRRWLPVLLKDALPLPVRLLDTPRAKVWYLPDWRLRQPKANILLKLYVDGDFSSPREVVLGGLYEAVIEEGLNEFGYPIREAGLSYSVNKVKGGITVSLGGYSDRMLELLQFLMERLAEVTVSDEAFAAIKEKMVRRYENQRLAQPYTQSRYFSRMLLASPNFTIEAQLEALRPIALADVRAYAKNILRATYLEGVVVGNLSPDTARGAIRKALDTLGARPLPESRRVRERILALPKGADWVYSDRLDVNNSLISMIYQVGRSNPSLRGALLMISRPLGQEFYFRMRTRQQLGYIVWGGMGQMRKMLHLSFLVQSGQYPADELQRRMEAFLPTFLRYFRELPDEEFEKFRRAVIRAKLEREKTLSGIAERLFWVAFRHDERFDYISGDIAAVEALGRKEVEEVLSRYLDGGGTKRLVIRLIGKGHAAGAPKGQPVRLPGSVRAKAG